MTCCAVRASSFKVLLNVRPKGKTSSPSHRELVLKQQWGTALPDTYAKHLLTTHGAVAMNKAACGHGGQGLVHHGRVRAGFTVALDITRPGHQVRGSLQGLEPR